MDLNGTPHVLHSILLMYDLKRFKAILLQFHITLSLKSKFGGQPYRTPF